tara:strand:+ start:1955 stop:3187 length:1233 start_codon:yes stop_codon:yes gene_type:complete
MSLKNNYLNTRKVTEVLVKPLEAEDFVCQPTEEVSPLKWHLAHTTWFFENFILAKFVSDYQLFNSTFNFLFNSYYNSQGSRILRNERGFLSRPSTEIIFEYRKYVDKHLSKLLENESVLKNELVKFLEIGINHEQQHQELLLTDIKYILGSNPLLPIYKVNQKLSSQKALPLNWLEIEEGVYSIGYSGNEFHFDNEREAHKVYINAFAISNRLITNGEYQEFIADKGYERAELWLADGWDWKNEKQAQAPMYWFLKENEWWHYRLDGIRKIDPNETLVHVNFYEADAFARWKGCRLATEAEWEVAANKYGNSIENAHFSDNNLHHPQVAADTQFFGTVWEWTNSAYLPYPGYVQAEGALGEYNGKFMVNQMVLKGGSLATPKNHFRPTYRNFFQPNLQWQFSGIRLAKNL